MMANGQTVGELARAVGYSEREMFRLLRSLYERMGVRNRTEALLKAAQSGLLT
jgi:DNA-binding CsgD family transcriptional regulator